MRETQRATSETRAKCPAGRRRLRPPHSSRLSRGCPSGTDRWPLMAESRELSYRDKRMPANDTLLTPETEEKVRRLGEADILVGIPSYNNAETIGHVVRAVNAGLAKYFPGARSVLVNSDGGSSDGTQEVVNKTVADLHALFIGARQRPTARVRCTRSSHPTTAFPERAARSGPSSRLPAG